MRKLLLVAPTVDRTDVGEAWVGYQWASLLSERHDVTLLTYSKRDRPSIAEQLPHTRVVEWRELPLVGRLERLNSLLKPAYFPFALRARRWITDALQRGERFDVAHQPGPVAMRYPSPLVGLGIPYVLGPVGGGLVAPPSFEAEDTSPWWTNLRRVDALRLRHDPWLRKTYEQAGCVLGIAPYVNELLQGVRLRRLEYMADVGLVELPPSRREYRSTGTVRLLFVGRVVRTKGVRDAIAALARLKNLPVHLDVVGDGFDLDACKQLADALGVSGMTTFHGALPRERVDAFYREADVFVFPSYREAGGTVVFEAMGFGLPMIVCEQGGPGAATDETCAFRLPVHDPAQYADAIADAVTQLVRNPSLRRAMGEAARQRVSSVGLWSNKVASMDRVYDELAPTDR